LDGIGFAPEVILRDLEHVEDLGTYFFTEVRTPSTAPASVAAPQAM
jgi:hypothetical protein